MDAVVCVLTDVCDVTEVAEVVDAVDRVVVVPVLSDVGLNVLPVETLVRLVDVSLVADVLVAVETDVVETLDSVVAVDGEEALVCVLLLMLDGVLTLLGLVVDGEDGLEDRDVLVSVLNVLAVEIDGLVDSVDQVDHVEGDAVLSELADALDGVRLVKDVVDSEVVETDVVDADEALETSHSQITAMAQKSPNPSRRAQMMVPVVMMVAVCV